jgi:hypothetical protein
MPDNEIRSAVRAHLGAGCLVVAAIAGLMSAWHLPIVIGSLLKSNREAVFSAAFELAFSLAFALAVWLLFFLPSSLVADMITKDRSARLWWSAFLCMIGVGATSLAVSARHGLPSITPTNIVVSVEYSVVLGLGCGFYSFLRSSFSPRGK